MSKKVLVVFGATGGQGGSVIRSILADPRTASQFTVRGITRDTSKPAAKALAEQGVEVVSANLDDKSSVVAALKGAHAAYLVTDFWATMSAETEIQQGKNVADAAKEHGIQHLVFSSLLNMTELTQGAFSHILHFDSKAEVESYIRHIGVPATFFLAGFYMSNLPGGMMRQNPETKTWALTLPLPGDTPIPLFATEYDTGKFVKGILLNREKLLGHRIYGATSYTSPVEIVDTFKKVYPEAGVGAKFVQNTPEQFKAALAARGMPEAIQLDLLENMQEMNEFGYFGGAKLDESHAIVDEKLTTWEEFIKQAKPFADLK